MKLKLGKSKKDKEQGNNEMKKVHIVVIGTENDPNSPKSMNDGNIPPRTSGADLKTQLGLDLDFILRRRSTGEVINNTDDVYQKIDGEGEKLLLNPPAFIGAYAPSFFFLG